MRRLIPILIGGTIAITGCARNIPDEITQLNRDWQNARKDCASVYAEDTVRSLQSQMDSMNQLADDKKYGKAKRDAVALQGPVEEMKEVAGRSREEAERRASGAIDKATQAIDAARQVEAGTYAESEFRSAQMKLGQARRMLKDPCKYPEALQLAEETEALARRAATGAVAEKRRIEAERRRAEEEARRLEEERRLREKPPVYTVQEGDCLWCISEMGKIYGNPILWPVIFENNKGKISDPDLIYPGQEFRIPRDIPETEMERKARRYYRQRPE